MAGRAPLMDRRSTESFLADLGIKIQKTSKEWITIYKGKPLRSIAVRHGKGQTGIKLPYVWKVLAEKLKRDGLEPGSKEYEKELRGMKKEAMHFI
ncbi:MAG: hypothetical protein CMH62_00840 [Nanoarchaeota archaeon]|nr:hypothetical protein [Nanoarchaeota archaeon]|tara:strand:+ start:1656 stop:1940 length:285 start_codon:yes stop_codon:yes gene_type:complete